MTEDDVDAMIAPLYARGQLARDEAWRAFEATLSELRQSLVAQARFVSNFGHLTTHAMTAGAAAEQALRESIPEPPVGYSHPLPNPDYSEDDESFERRLSWMRQNTPRSGENQ